VQSKLTPSEIPRLRFLMLRALGSSFGQGPVFNVAWGSTPGKKTSAARAFWPKAIFNREGQAFVNMAVGQKTLKTSCSWGVTPGYVDNGLRLSAGGRQSAQLHNLHRALILCALTLAAAGCGDVDEIRRYQAPKTQTSAVESPHPKSAAKSPHPQSDDSVIQFETPDGWKPGELVISRGGITIRHQAAFVVSDGQRRIEITVDRMPAMGSFLQNVNRWRGQIGLEPIEREELDEVRQSIEIGGSAADYVELVGQSESILGVIAIRENEAWYLKLKGDNELANREKENFQAFVKSIKFN